MGKRIKCNHMLGYDYEQGTDDDGLSVYYADLDNEVILGWIKDKAITCVFKFCPLCGVQIDG